MRVARDTTAVCLRLLKLLLLHVDPAKTDWRWLLQSCACLFGDRQAFLVAHQGRIIEQYAQVGVCINPDDFKVAFQRPGSRVYRRALVEYIDTMIMEMPESDDEDDRLEARDDGGGNEAENGAAERGGPGNEAEKGAGERGAGTGGAGRGRGNEAENGTAERGGPGDGAVGDNAAGAMAKNPAAPCAKSNKRRRVAKGRASLLQTAKLLVQLPMAALCHVSRQLPNSTQIRRHLA